MRTSSIYSRFTRQCRSFARAERGNVALIFAFAMIPVIGLVGAAIDYSRANSARANMQAAADSAALAVSLKATTLTSSQIQSSASDTFNALFNEYDVSNVQIGATYTTKPSQVVVTASADFKPTFMSMSYFGFSTIPLKVSATTTWGNTRLRVALALDNTGSMASSGKLTALKTAATNLLTQLKAAATADGDVYVSIIPFSRDVNVGSSNKDATWLKWSKSGKNSDAWDQNNGSCTGTSWWGTTTYNYDNEYDCQNAGKTWNVSSHSTWNGCVMDRDQDYDTNSTAPKSGDTGSPSTLFWPQEYSSCPVELMQLSYDWTKLNSKINNMQANGSTNQAIGLAWAWLSLLQQSPLDAPAESTDYTYQKVIILLTDGLNTQDRWYGNGSSVSTKVDDRQKLLCANVKSAGITLYTIQVNTDGDATSTLLQNCASSSDKFFLLTSATQIITTFEQIGTNLSKLRVAQ